MKYYNEQEEVLSNNFGLPPWFTKDELNKEILEMALNWNWNDKVGEMHETVYDTDGSIRFERTIDLYSGNALLIGIYNYEENGNKYYTLTFFFADENHMKACLNIGKNKNESDVNIFDFQYSKTDYIKLNSNYRNAKKIVNAIMTACNNITIEFYKGEKI